MQHAALASTPYTLTLADRLTRRHFRTTLPRNRRAEFDDRFATVLSSERNFISDRTTHGHIVMLSSALCAYRIWIAEGLDPASAKRAVGMPVSTLWKRSTGLTMWALSVFSKDTFEALRKYTIERTGAAYGPSFEINYLEIDDGFVSEVQTCGFRTFFARHDACELLDLFCEWDRTWINGLPQSIRFHRPPTIAQGGPSCRFEFRRE